MTEREQETLRVLAILLTSYARDDADRECLERMKRGEFALTPVFDPAHRMAQDARGDLLNRFSRWYHAWKEHYASSQSR